MLSLQAWVSGTAQAPTQEPRYWAGPSSAANHFYVLPGADQVPSTPGQGKKWSLTPSGPPDTAEPRLLLIACSCSTASSLPRGRKHLLGQLVL